MAFSDYLYMQRGFGAIFLFAFFFYSLWRSDKFKAFSFERICRFELRSIVCLMMVVFFPIEIAYDVLKVGVNYSEGVNVTPMGTIIAKPISQWSPRNRALSLCSDYFGGIGLSLQVSVLFLLQAFWNYLANSITRRSFMSSLEWRLYLVFAMFTLILHPLLQSIFSVRSQYISEMVVVVTFCTEGYIIAGLGILSHLRFNRLIANHKMAYGLTKRSSVVGKLSYFREMNMILSVFLAMASTTGFTISLDALTPTSPINSSKLATDILTCFGVFSEDIVWVVLINIFFPSRAFMIDAHSQDGNSTPQMTPARVDTRNSENYLSPNAIVPSSFENGSAPSKSVTSISKTITIEVNCQSEDNISPLSNNNYYPS